jgi:hypothetical protein
MADIKAHTASTNDFLKSLEGDKIWDETALTYFFAQSGDSAAVASEDTSSGNNVFAGTEAFDPLQSSDTGDAGIRQDVLNALAAWALVADIPTFSAAANFAAATFKVAGVDDWGGTLGQMDFPGSNMVGSSTTQFESMLYLNASNYLSDRGETGGSPLGSQNALHELGHGLGLGHPHDDGHGTSDVSDVSASASSEVVWDNERFTVMSYEKGGWNVNTAGTFGRAVSPMALDIAAMQNMYGATSAYETNTTYTLTNAGVTALDIDGSDGSVSIGRAFYSIWDTGGTDSIEYGGSNRSVINLNNATLSMTDDDRILDLTDSLMIMDGYQDLPDEVKNNIESADYHGGGFFSAVFSASGTMQLGGYSIASDFKDSDAKIENAEGGSGDDVLIGNALDNTLTGNAGNDLLSGSDGDDSLFGGAGEDRLSGGQGDDLLDGGAAEDKVYFLDSCDNYEIDKDTDTGIVTISHVDGTMADGVDTLIDVEYAVFADDTVDLTVDDPACSPIDFIFLVDLSGSFGDDLPSFTAAAPAIFDTVRATDPESQFAVASFVDYPFSPYGSPGDYLYQPELALTADRTAFQTALGGLDIKSGGDFPESQWAGIWGAANGIGLGLRENSRKIILIATDASAHSASDYGLSEGEVLDFLVDNSTTTIGGAPGHFIDPTDIGDTSPDYVGAGRDDLLAEVAGGLFGETSLILALTPGTEDFYMDALPRTLATSVAPLSRSGDDISDAVSFGLADLAGDVSEAGTSSSDTLTGTVDDDNLFGLGGDDEIDGLAGNDTVDGGSGSDTVSGGAGDDDVRGGTGDDELDGGAGNDKITGGSGRDEIFDGLGNDTVTGGDGADVILIMAGANNISGGADADILIGGNQADTIDGGSGNDIIRGEASDGLLAGSDRIIGGTGDDIMMGGRGSDTFVFATGDGNDEIGKFAAADITSDFSGPSVLTTGVDFTSGLDMIELSGFTTIDAASVLDVVTDNDDGVAVFVSEGTQITFAGLAAADLSADDFAFV